MERRKTSRHKKRLTVSIDGKAAILNNISREGLQISMTGLPSTRQVIIKFQIEDREIEVKGVVLWIKKNSFLYQPNLVGISVTSFTSEYERLVEEKEQAKLN